MKKLLSMLLILVVSLTLAACGGDKENSSSSNSSSSSSSSSSSNQPTDDATVVTLAHWGLGTEADNNIWRRKIAMFNETHDDIQIQIVQHEGDWNQWLTTKAAAGEIPDVFMVNSVPEAAINQWSANIADIVENDPEWLDIPAALRDTVTYGDGVVYGIPAAYHYLGYFANITLLETANINTDFQSYDFSVEEFFAAVTAAKNTNATTPTIGLDASGEIVNWLPSALDEDGLIQHFLWDGAKFDYTSQEMTETIAKAVALATAKETFASYSDQVDAEAAEGTVSEREDLFGTKDFNKAFMTGRLGFRWGATWDASSYETNIDGDFTYDFVGIPGSRVVGVSDYMVVSKTAKDKEAAYEVTKYLTFGSEGIWDTFEIIEKADEEEGITLTMAGLPINERRAIMDKWFETFPQAGFQAIYEKAKAGEYTVLMEGNKYVPGFANARWNYNTGIDAQISRPTAEDGKTLSIGDLVYDASNNAIKWSDHMTTELADKINAELQKAVDQLEALN